MAALIKSCLHKIIPFFFILDHQKNSLFFTNWLMFSNVGRIYVFFLLACNIFTEIVRLFFSNFFHSFFPEEKFISFQLYLPIKDLIFDILFECILISLWFNASIAAYWKHLSSLFFGFIISFLFFIQTGESIYDPPRFRFILWDL